MSAEPRPCPKCRKSTKAMRTNAALCGICQEPYPATEEKSVAARLVDLFRGWPT